LSAKREFSGRLRDIFWAKRRQPRHLGCAAQGSGKPSIVVLARSEAATADQQQRENLFDKTRFAPR
jgi:hypothetical protein